MRTTLFFLFVFSSSLLSSQNKPEVAKINFKQHFDQARNLLLESKTQQAIPILKKLHKSYPENANINYLLGICYTESSVLTDMSIYHLEKAKPFVSKKYTPNTHLESNAPIFLHYFLVVAYAQNRLCGKAYQTFSAFRNLYGINKTDFYILDALRWIEACSTPEETKTMEIASKPITKKEQTPKKTEPNKVKENYDKNKDFLTKHTSYSTQQDIYSIQVAAVSKVVPIYQFDQLKNVHAFMDQKGLIRYVIGKFTSKRQAENLLKVVKEKGYPDAFIVNVNQEKKYKEELISYDNLSINRKKGIDFDTYFSAQIGAFTDTIPKELAEKYTMIDDIHELEHNSMTLVCSGRFSNYNNVKLYKEKLKEFGISDAFIVAIKNNKKIPITPEMIEE